MQPGRGSQAFPGALTVVEKLNVLCNLLNGFSPVFIMPMTIFDYHPGGLFPELFCVPALWDFLHECASVLSSYKFSKLWCPLFSTYLKIAR